MSYSIISAKRGHVYFAYSQNKDLMKIGATTQEIEKRLAAIRSDFSVPDLQLVGTVFAPAGVFEMENLFHRAFDHLRLHYEWFRVEDRLLMYVQQEFNFLDDRKLVMKTWPFEDGDEEEIVTAMNSYKW